MSVGRFGGWIRLGVTKGFVVIHEVHPVQLLPTLRWSSYSEALTNVFIGPKCEPERATHRNTSAWISNPVPNLTECNTSGRQSVFRLFQPVTNLTTRRVVFGCGLIARTPSTTTHLRIHSANFCSRANPRKRLQESSLSTELCQQR